MKQDDMEKEKNFISVVVYVYNAEKRLETFFYCILEISGGVLSIKSLHLSEAGSFVVAHAALAFNGLSCHLQTFHLINDCPFSRKKYMLHKIILCSITCILLFIFLKNK